MKPSRTKEERSQDQINRGLAADRLITDDVVIAWFASEHKRLVEEMIRAPIDDDTTRRAAAVRLQALNDLKSHLTNEATFGRKELEKAKANA